MKCGVYTSEALALSTNIRLGSKLSTGSVGINYSYKIFIGQAPVEHYEANLKSAATLSMTILGIMTLSIMTLSIMKVSIMTLSLMTLSTMTLSIMTLSLMTVSIMTVSITVLSIITSA
jgi:hypothetical protein